MIIDGDQWSVVKRSKVFRPLQVQKQSSEVREKVGVQVKEE